MGELPVAPGEEIQIGNIVEVERKVYVGKPNDEGGLAIILEFTDTDKVAVQYLVGNQVWKNVALKRCTLMPNFGSRRSTLRRIIK